MTNRVLRVTLHPIFVMVVLVCTWELVSRGGLVPTSMLPPPSDVLAVLWKQLQRPAVWSAIGVTAWEVAVAFVIALPLGVVIAVGLHESPFWGAVFRPFFQFLFSIPKSIFLPLFILSIGIGIPQKIAYGVFSMVFIIVICVSAAIESVKASHVLVAHCYGASRVQIFRHVYLPSMLPSLLEATRLGMIFNFTGVILAEMYVSQIGIGKLIGTWGENYQIPQLIGGILLVSAAAVLFNESIRAIENKYGHWRT